jgi:Uma2 family endonuclease
MVVEVRSPTTWRYDIGRKRELDERHGVRELWLADTAGRTARPPAPGGRAAACAMIAACPS